MSEELPNGWHWVRLGEICDEDRLPIDKSDSDYAAMPYLGLEHIESGTGRILVTEAEARETDSKSNNFRFTAEHVLYGKLRPYLNKVALPDFSGRCTTEIVPLRATAADRTWLAWLLRRGEVVDYAMRGKTGTQMPRTSMPDLMRLPVALPPLDEQRRIVDTMSLVDRARSVAEAQLITIDELTTAMLREIFPRSPTAPLRRGWRSAKLGDLCMMTIGRTPRRAESRYWGGPHAWATISDITASDGTVSETRETLSDSGADVCAGRLLKAGTLLFSFKLSIGRIAIAGRDLYTNEAIVGLTPREDRDIDRAYLRYALAAVDYDGLVGHAVKGRTLNRKTLALLDLPLPALQEQQRIASTFSTTQHARAGAMAQLAAINELSDTLLKHLLAPAAG